jgi:thiosulfate dehydrogenase (quinone) large subunit
MQRTDLERHADAPSPRVAQLLFRGWLGAILFLPLRLYFGVEWWRSGWEKVTDSAWMNSPDAVGGFAAGAIERGTQGDHPAVAYGWWVNLLEFLRDNAWAASLMGKVVAVGELAIAVALVIGAFTGIAAALGATLNFSFLFSGTAGVNPAYLLAEILLIAGWRVAGQLGADAWILGRLIGREAPERKQLLRLSRPRHA